MWLEDNDQKRVASFLKERVQTRPPRLIFAEIRHPGLLCEAGTSAVLNNIKEGKEWFALAAEIHPTFDCLRQNWPSVHGTPWPPPSPLDILAVWYGARVRYRLQMGNSFDFRLDPNCLPPART